MRLGKETDGDTNTTATKQDIRTEWPRNQGVSSSNRKLSWQREAAQASQSATRQQASQGATRQQASQSATGQQASQSATRHNTKNHAPVVYRCFQKHLPSVALSSELNVF